MQDRFRTFTALINRINRNIRKIKNLEMAEYQLRSAHISCLYYLFMTEGLTATELCEYCEEDKATISRAIDYLEKNGYLTCEPKTAKRYKSPIILTGKGTAVGQEIFDKINLMLSRIGSSLNEEQRADFYRYLISISADLDNILTTCENMGALNETDDCII